MDTGHQGYSKSKDDDLSVPPVESPLDQDNLLAHAIFDRSDCAIIIIDRDGVIRRTNPACTLITGFRSEDLLGRRYMDVMVPPELVQSSFEKLYRVVESKETIQCETPWLTKDGGRCLLKGTFSVVLKPDGEFDYIVGIGTDVTAERSAQKEL